MLLNANKGHYFIESVYDYVLFVALVFVFVLFPIALSLCLCGSKAVITRTFILLFCLSRTPSVAKLLEPFPTKLQ